MAKKIFLTIIWIILLAVLTELFFLRFGVVLFHKYYNDIFQRHKTEKNIICIGESFTAVQYPQILRDILNKKYPGIYSVIDCGIDGGNMNMIFNSMDAWIEKYNPDIAICMIGLNDRFCERKNKNVQKKKLYLKILLKRIKNNIIKYFNTEAFADDITADNLFNKAKSLSDKGDFKHAVEILEKIIKEHPSDQRIFYELTKLYCDYMRDDNYKNKGISMAKYAIDNNFKYNKYIYYKYIFEFCEKDEDFKNYVQNAFEKDIDIFNNYTIHNAYRYIRKSFDYIDSLSDSDKKKIFEKLNMKNEDDYIFLGIESVKNNNFKQAEQYFNLAGKVSYYFINEQTAELYKRIIKKLIDNNIKVICMQYPIKSIEPLKEMLKKELYYDKITFISNEYNFQNMLKTVKYDDLFRDQFFGGIGHCTKKGNRLIAENIVDSFDKNNI